MKEKKIKLHKSIRDGNGHYIVAQTINMLEPEVDTFITKEEVKKLINEPGVEVTIVPTIR